MGETPTRRQELAFTAAATVLLTLVLAAYLSVRLAKTTHAGRLDGPAITSVFPASLVPNVTQRVTVRASGSHFGPGSIVESDREGVYVSRVGFDSPGALWFDVFVAGDDDAIDPDLQLRVRSPLDEENVERMAIQVPLGEKRTPLALDLFSFRGKEHVHTNRRFVMLGYRPTGYGPFDLRVTSLITGKRWKQRTEQEIEHLGIPLEEGPNDLELLLRDALGREVREHVTVDRGCAVERPGAGLLTSLASRTALYGGYTGGPVTWAQPPGDQIQASECSLGNGTLLGCKDCKRLISPPPNDYETSTGEAAIGADGVQLHNGDFSMLEVTDFEIPGRGLHFTWKRSYQSGIDLDGYLGRNWDFSWGASFELDSYYSPQEGYFSRGDCRRDTYDDYEYDYGSSRYEFTTLPGGFYDIECSVYSSQISQVKRNGFQQDFDVVTSLLKRRTDRYGNQISVLYDYMGDISRIKDTLDRYYDFHYGSSGAADGRLIEISDPDGDPLVEYEYDYAYQYGPVVLTEVSYRETDWIDDSSNDPTEWVSKTAQPRVITYEWDGSARIDAVLDGRGVERLSNTYDAAGRVIEQFAYGSGIGAAYHEFAYELDAAGTVEQVTHTTPGGDDREFYFDTDTHLVTKVEVEYDAAQSPATTEIERDCACASPSGVIEPDGGYTRWTFDSDGNVTELRRCYDHDDDADGDYDTTAGLDIVYKAYYAGLNATMLGVMTKIVGPMGFASGASEADHAVVISYDDKANPTSIAFPGSSNPNDPIGETRVYNSSGQLIRIEREEGMEVRCEYYTDGYQEGYLQKKRVLYSTGAYLDTTYQYDQLGTLTKITNPRGYSETLTLDGEGLITRTTNEVGDTIDFHYNGNRQLVHLEVENSVTPTNPWDTYLFYDDAGLLTKRRREIETVGSTTTWQEVEFGYDDDHRLVEYEDPLGNVTEYAYDPRGLVTSVTFAAGSGDESEVRYEYDEEGKLVETERTFQNPGSATTLDVTERRFYDRFDRLCQVLDGAGGDAVGDSIAYYYYDLASRLTRVSVEDASDDELSRVVYEYDRRGLRTKVKRGPSAEDTRSYEYDRAARLTKITDDRGGTYEYEYDKAGRLVTKHLPTLNGLASGRNRTEIAYDAASNVVSTTTHAVDTTDYSSPVDHVWSFSYDDADRLTQRVFKGSRSSGPYPTWSYDARDARGLLTQRTDPEGVSTIYAYNGLGLRTSQTIDPTDAGDPRAEVNIVLETMYDAAGNITGKDDGDGNETELEYDDQNRLKRLEHPGGDWVEYRYNDLGLVSTKYSGDGATVNDWDLRVLCTYDTKGLLSEKDIAWRTTPTWSGYSDYRTTEETFEYDGIYRLTSAEDDDTKLELTYNDLGQLTAEKLEIKSGGSWKAQKTTEYSYDWASSGGVLSKVRYPVSGKEFEHRRDALGRLTKIEWYDPPYHTLAKYWYRGPGPRVVKRERGTDIDGTNPTIFRTTLDYDTLGRLTDRDEVRVSGSQTTLASFDYEWGDGTDPETERYFSRSGFDMANGVVGSESHDYGYDGLGRLVSDDQGDEHLYSYSDAQFYEKRESKVGQTTTTEIEFTEATNGSQQIASYSDGASRTCSYDDLGNLASDSGGGASGQDYRFDYANRLVHIDGATDYWFRYDALGRLVEKKEGSGGTYDVELYYYAGSHVIEETSQSQSLRHLSLHGTGVDEILLRCEISGGAFASCRWPLADDLATAHSVVDDSGVETTDFDYATAYGETTRTGEAFPIAYTGRRHLEDADLYHYRSRAYDPRLARFLQRDRAGNWFDESNLGNPYAYVGGDPANHRDPSGALSTVAYGARSRCWRTPAMRRRTRARIR